MINLKNAQSNLDKCNTLPSLRTFMTNAKRLIANGNDTPAVRSMLAAAEDKYWNVSASRHGAGVEVDKALWNALEMYEDLRSRETGRRFRSTYLWRKILRTDIVTAVSDAVKRGRKTIGLKSLEDMDRIDVSFEEVVVNFKHAFREDVVEAAEFTLDQFSKTKS